MGVGFRNASGTDASDTYDPYVSGNQNVATGFRNAGGGTLLYAPLNIGAAAANFNMRLGSAADFSSLWARKGTASYALPLNGGHYLATNTAKTSAADTTYAFIDVRINNDGTYQLIERISGGGNGGSQVAASGTWLPSGQSVGDYQVQFGATNTGPAVVTNSAASFQSCSVSQVLTLQASTPSRSSTTVEASVNVTILLRRNGVTNSTTSFTAQVTATGAT